MADKAQTATAATPRYTWDLRQDPITFEWLLRPEWKDNGTVPFVCTITGDEAKEAAQLIFRAVNSFKSDRKALSQSLDTFRSISKEPSAKQARMKAQAAYEKVRAALEEKSNA